VQFYCVLIRYQSVCSACQEQDASLFVEVDMIDYLQIIKGSLGFIGNIDAHAADEAGEETA
jgi:hypothetical protein